MTVQRPNSHQRWLWREARARGSRLSPWACVRPTPHAAVPCRLLCIMGLLGWTSGRGPWPSDESVALAVMLPSAGVRGAAVGGYQDLWLGGHDDFGFQYRFHSSVSMEQTT